MLSDQQRRYRPVNGLGQSPPGISKAAISYDLILGLAVPWSTRTKGRWNPLNNTSMHLGGAHGSPAVGGTDRTVFAVYSDSDKSVEKQLRQCEWRGLHQPTGLVSRFRTLSTALPARASQPERVAASVTAITTTQLFRHRRFLSSHCRKRQYGEVFPRHANLVDLFVMELISAGCWSVGVFSRPQQPGLS